MLSRLLFALLTASLLLLFLETVSCAFFRLQQEHYTFAEPETFTIDAASLRQAPWKFDAELGWTEGYDTPFGERPRERDYPTTRLATFGDSYTHCDDVDHDETWQTYLSRAIEEDVFNFGVGGYGTDQAFLRFRRDYPRVQAPLVMLGLIPNDLARMLNVYRKFLLKRTALPLTKPRFILEGETLNLIPNPIQSVHDLEQLQRPDFIRSLGADDDWYNSGDYPHLAFPHSAILLHCSTWREIRYSILGREVDDLRPRPWANVWDDPQAIALLFAVFDHFVDEARQAGATPLIMIQLTHRQLVRAYDTQQIPAAVQHVVDYGRRRDVLVFNAASALLSTVSSMDEVAALGPRHMSPKANALLAAQLQRFLTEQDLLRS